MQSLEFPYKPRPLQMLLLALVGCLITGVGMLAAASNDEGLTIMDIITLEPQSATIFWWCDVALCAALSVLGLVISVVGFRSKNVLTITATEISVPRRVWSARCTVVPLNSIHKMVIQTANRQRFLQLHHPHGRLAVVESLLPNKQAFDDVQQWIAQRVNT